MARTVMVRARSGGRLKAEAEAVLEKLGLNASDAIRLFYRQVTMRKGFPFDVAIPDATTRRALREADEGRNLLGPFEDTDQLILGRTGTHSDAFG
jgi:DNA-damage-inducible protein J